MSRRKTEEEEMPTMVKKEELKEEEKWTTHTSEVLGDVGQTVRSALEKVPVGKEAEYWGLTLALVFHGLVNLVVGLALLIRPQLLFPMAKYFKAGSISWSFFRKFGLQALFSSALALFAGRTFNMYEKRIVNALFLGLHLFSALDMGRKMFCSNGYAFVPAYYQIPMLFLHSGALINMFIKPGSKGYAQVKKE